MTLVKHWALRIQQWGDLGVVPAWPLDKLAQAQFLIFFPIGEEDIDARITQTSKNFNSLLPLHIFPSKLYWSLINQNIAYIYMI